MNEVGSPCDPTSLLLKQLGGSMSILIELLSEPFFLGCLLILLGTGINGRNKYHE